MLTDTLKVFKFYIFVVAKLYSDLTTGKTVPRTQSSILIQNFGAGGSFLDCLKSRQEKSLRSIVKLHFIVQ